MEGTYELFKKLKEHFQQNGKRNKTVPGRTRETRKGFIEKVSDLVIRRKKIDEEFYEELEEILIGADVGVNTVMDLMDDLRAEVKKRRIEDAPICASLVRETDGTPS